MRRRAPIAGQALALLASAACHSYRAVPLPVPERSLVRVRFETPRTLHLVGRVRDTTRTVRIDDVTMIDGQVLAARGDTLDLGVTVAWRGRERATGVPIANRAIVVPDPGRPAEQLRASTGRTALLLASIAATIAAIFVTWLHIVMSDPDY